MPAILYSRVSTDAQERDGTSLDTQERASLEFAAANGWTVVDTVIARKATGSKSMGCRLASSTMNLWQRVAGIFDDPERLRRPPEGRFHLLGGRSRCAICGSAMVGQTLTPKQHPYRYYRCRHVYDRNHRPEVRSAVHLRGRARTGRVAAD